MQGGLLLLLFSVVHKVKTKFVEIDIPLNSHLKNHAGQQASVDDIIDNIRRSHHKIHKGHHHTKVHHSLHSIEQNSPWIEKMRGVADTPPLSEVLPPSVIAADKRYDHFQEMHGNDMMSSWPKESPSNFKTYMRSMGPRSRKHNDYVKGFHLYGVHGNGDGRRFSLKEAQDGLSSQEREHPGNSLFYLKGNPILGSVKFPKKKPDDHNVYGNLQTLGLINIQKQYHEARAKNRPKPRPPDASQQPQLLFDPNHPGMTLVHPNEKFILGYAKFSKPAESAHRVYGNDYNIGVRLEDKKHPVRFQYSSFRRNLNNKQNKRSASPSQYIKSPLDRILTRKMQGGWSPQFGRARFSNPRGNNFNTPEDLSYRSLILRSRQSDEESPPWRLPLKIPIKIPTRQQQRLSKRLRSKTHPVKSKWQYLKAGKKSPVLRNNEKSNGQYDRAKFKFLRNRQTIPPWVHVIEKDSKESEKMSSKSKIPADKLIYGNFDNLGIRYGNEPYRQKYSNFRKNKKGRGKMINVKSGKKAPNLRIGQTIPPWIQVIEKNSKEIENNKVKKLPADKLVYGHFDNLGIRYGNQPYRVKFSNFRKNGKHRSVSRSAFEPSNEQTKDYIRQRKPKKPSVKSQNYLPLKSSIHILNYIDTPNLRYGNEADPVAFVNFRKNHPVLQAKGQNKQKSQNKPKRMFLRSKKSVLRQPDSLAFGYSDIPVFSSLRDVYSRRLSDDRVLAALLQHKLKNGKLNTYARQLQHPDVQTPYRSERRYFQNSKRNNKIKGRETRKIVDAVLKAIKNSNDKKQHLYKRGPDLVALAAVRPSDMNAKNLNYRPLNTYLKDSVEKNNYEVEDDASEIYSSEEGGYNNNYRRSKHRDRSESYEKKTKHNCTQEDSSSSTSSSGEKNPGNPYTIFKNKYKQNWLWNHFMDGNHMNVNPYGPEFDALGPSGTELFFGRKWWYYNQDDYRPFRRR